MIKKIKVDQLRPGIFVSNLNCDWLHHPFLSNEIKINNEDHIKKIIQYGIREVYIDTDRGSDVADASEQDNIGPEIQTELMNLSDTKPVVFDRVPIKEEIVRAEKILRDAKKTFQGLMEDVRLGKHVNITQVEDIVDKLIDSISHNRDAMTSLLRIRKKDEYTYVHSLAVSALLVSFGEHLNLDYKTIKAIGIGGLLHDIGKVKIPANILQKKGALSDKEFEIMKDHVKYSCGILEKSAIADDNSIYVVTHHHERLNGAGYPLGLKGNEISFFGQMSAIVDVYDALSSDRCYRNKMPPTETLRKLFEWSDVYFNRKLVEHFICCIGIYPVGTLVRLDNGLICVVIDHGEKGLLHPVVRVVYDAKNNKFVTPRDIDLSKSPDGNLIINYESPERWNINPETYLSIQL